MNANIPIGFSRRALLGSAGVFAAVLVQTRTRAAQAKTTAAGDIEQPARAAPKAYIERAFELRRQAVETGDQAYGAAIVKDARIIG